MSNLRVLVVNDFSSGAFLFQKYLKSKVSVIYFGNDPVISPTRDPLYFERRDIPSQVSRLRELASLFDVFVCFGWIASAICYLANVNYIMYFVDSYIEPKDRIRKKMFFIKRHLVLDLFADAVMHASKIVTVVPKDVRTLRKYHDDVTLVLPMVDPQMFNLGAGRINLGESKFAFFSPGRIDKGKNQHLIWDSIRLTSSDFVVVQPDWGSGPYYEELMSNRPDKVKIIPKIKREQISAYYASSDAVLGQISLTTCGSVEREAALCGKAVFCYAPDCFTASDPFYKGNLAAEEIAKYIDRMVTDEKFRTELADSQHKWITENFDNNKIAEKWEAILQDSVSKNLRYRTKSRYLRGLELIHRLTGS